MLEDVQVVAESPLGVEEIREVNLLAGVGDCHPDHRGQSRRRLVPPEDKWHQR